MKMSVRNKSWAERFTEWVFDLPNYQAIFFMVPVMLIYIVAVTINIFKGDSK